MKLFYKKETILKVSKMMNKLMTKNIPFTL